MVLKGTGKAIDKTLQLALWFQQRAEYNVAMRTASIGAIDDIVPNDEVLPVHDHVIEAEDAPKMDMDEEVPEARIRYTSVLEVWITQR